MGKTLKMWSSRGWIVVTGGGSGIGRAIVTHFSEKYNILTCARRWSSLEETKAQACRPEHVLTVEADISDETDRARFVTSLPSGAPVILLVQNAAIGDPARLTEVSLTPGARTQSQPGGSPRPHPGSPPRTPPGCWAHSPSRHFSCPPASGRIPDVRRHQDGLPPSLQSMQSQVS